jgi:hypothetical protein
MEYAVMAERKIRGWGGYETGICYVNALNDTKLPIKELNVKFKFFIGS